MTEARTPLIVICGPPCSGKTTLAAKLHTDTGLAYLAIDRILRRILPDSSFKQADRDIAYRVLGFTVEQLLGAGLGVIVDGTFARPPYLEELEVMASKYKARLFLVECRIDISVVLRRFRERGGQHPAVDLDEERVERLNLSYPYRLKGLVLDTSRPIDECLADIHQFFTNRDSSTDQESQGLAAPLAKESEDFP